MHFSIIALGLLSGCGGKNTEPYVKEPGAEDSSKKDVLETGAEVMQNKAPINAINLYLDGFHFYNGNMKGQMEAHHFCTVLNEDVTQCIIYDGNVKDAHIMGVEYIISEKLFKSLPEDEKKLWHSHNHEVKSGTLIAPGIPELAEHELMEKLISTYGKTWHTWHTDQDKELPYGSPQLMMGFTKDGQLEDSLLAKRDKNFKISTEEKRKNRADIPNHKILPGADSWQDGKVLQLSSLTKHEHKH
ncbi:hypothetical protein Slin_5113 [Sporocytophaga myxococcoides]|uniref:DUF1264 domain-containing protein n=2 Tax=Sporocytophaga myxococcoides TaxID=153721 RepID=A0A098LG84_9BACT|nr:hypothetical protein Slin_5113 [Sporocytophaga myxococcoides]